MSKHDREQEYVDVPGEPGLAAPLREWEAWLRKLPSIPMPEGQRRELESFAKQIISGYDPGRYPDVPPL